MAHMDDIFDIEDYLKTSKAPKEIKAAWRRFRHVAASESWFADKYWRIAEALVPVLLNIQDVMDHKKVRTKRRVQISAKDTVKLCVKEQNAIK